MINSEQLEKSVEVLVETTASPQKLAILDVAQVLFTEQGYEGLSIRDLAQHCGLAKATIYHHFRDKEGLYAAVIDYSHRSALPAQQGRGGRRHRNGAAGKAARRQPRL